MDEAARAMAATGCWKDGTAAQGTSSSSSAQLIVTNTSSDLESGRAWGCENGDESKDA